MTNNDFIFARYLGTSPVKLLLDKSLEIVGIICSKYFPIVSIGGIIIVTIPRVKILTALEVVLNFLY